MPTIDEKNIKKVDPLAVETFKEAYYPILEVKKQLSIDEANDALSSLQNQVKSHSESKKSISENEKSLVTIEAEIKKANELVANSKQEYDAINKDYTTYYKAVQNKESKLEKATEEVANLDSKLEETNKSISEKNVALNDLAQNITKLEAEVEKAKEDYANKLIKKVELNKIEKALKAENTNKSKLEKAIENEKSNLQDINSKISTEKKNLKTIEKQLNVLKTKFKTFEKQFSTASKNYKKHQEVLNKLDVNKKDLLNKIENLKKHILTDAKIKEINKQIEQTKIQIKDLGKREPISFSTLDTFKNFLSDNNLSTVHAEDLHNITIGTKKVSDLTDFRTRKRHPLLEWIAKKGSTLAGLAGGATWGTISAVIASNLPAGSTFKLFGLIPIQITGNIALTSLSAAILPALLGFGVTYGYFTIKKKATIKAHEKIYSTAKEAISNLEDVEDLKTLDAEIDKLDIVRCLNTISDETKKIIKLRKGKWYTAVPRFVTRHFKNMKNRNRLHHIEQFSKDLVAELDNSTYLYNYLNGDDKKKTKSKIVKITQLLKRIDNSIKNDLNRSKIYEFATCKEKGKHSHANIIENSDIYSNLKTYFNKVTILNPSNSEEKALRKEQVKSYKKEIRPYKKKHNTAEKLINGESCFDKIFKKYGIKVDNEQKATRTMSNFGVNPLNGTVTLNFSDNSQSVVVENVPNLENYQNVIINDDNKTITVIYKDGNTSIVPINKAAERIRTNTKDDKIQSEARKLECLTLYRKNLISAGFSPNKIDELINILTDYQSQKPKKCFQTTTKFTKGNYAAIYNEISRLDNNHHTPEDTFNL